MSNTARIALLEFWFFVFIPALGWVLVTTAGAFGSFLWLVLFVLWCWEIFAFYQYRYCRQEEFRYLLESAAKVEAPFELILRAYLRDRPDGDLYRFSVGSLLCFVFPGFYLIHQQRRFDARLAELVRCLEAGQTLDEALRAAPGLATRETALAITVGQFTGQLSHALSRFSSRRQAPVWLEIAPRLLYPLIVMLVILTNLSFVVIFIFPKFEKLIADFHVRMPPASRFIMEAFSFSGSFAAALPLVWLLLLGILNLLLLNSSVQWYFPLIGRLYRMRARSQFLQILGIMLQTGRPLPEVLDCTIESGLFPHAVNKRVMALAADLRQGQPLPASLAKHGLITAPMRGLVDSAQRVGNLPWALQELGDSLGQRCARLTRRIALAAFPLALIACACVVALVGLAVFMPLISILEQMNA